MKTLRFIGMAIVAIIMSVNFVACSDDDEDIDVSQLEGTWGLVRSAGWELCSEETEKDEWDDSYANLIIEALTTENLAIRVKYDNVQTDPESDPEHRHSGDFTETFTKME